jgi:multiple sugar transport system substrate-binding protein
MEKLPFVGFAQVPQIGDKYAVWGGSHQLSMTTDDPTKQAAAACWISWLSKNSAQWAKAGLVPVRQSIRSGPDLAAESPAVAAFAKEADDVIMPQPIPGLVTAVWGEGFGKAVDAVLLGQQADVKKALDDAAAKTDQLLQQNRQRYSAE